MTAPLLTIILTLTMLEDVNSIPLPDIPDWSKFHINIFNFDIKNNSTYLYEILECYKNLGGVSYRNTPVLDSGIQQSLYHLDLPTLPCIFSED